MSKPDKSSKKPDPRAKFVAARKAMTTALVGRDEEVKVVLTALLADEHPLLVGPPGTAKSLLLDSVMRWVVPNDEEQQAKKFSILFTKFTTPEEVFGPVSVNGLKEDVYRRVTAGRLPESHFAFADEIFKAGSSILNTMLRILNERTFENGDGQFRKVPLAMCVAASNEWPGDDGGKELGALFDRFLFRMTVRPVSSGAGMKRLLWDTEEDVTPEFDSHLTLGELASARKAVGAMPWTKEACQSLEAVVAELRAQGVVPGDRRLRKGVKAAAAAAYLEGDDEVDSPHLEALKHVYWADPIEQPAIAERVITKCADPVGFEVSRLVGQAAEVMTNEDQATAMNKCQSILRSINALSASKKKEDGVKAVKAMLHEMYAQATGGVMPGANLVDSTKPNFISPGRSQAPLPAPMQAWNPKKKP